MKGGVGGVQINEGRILQAGMNYHGGLSGMRYYEQGLVLWVVCSYGSAFGAVEEPDWGEVKAWAGLDGGHLVFKCEDCLLQGEFPSWLPRVEDDDEPEEPRDLLCKHAMAVALQALDEGASWYEIPKDPARLRPHEKADEFLRSGRMTLLSRLEAEENGLLLQYPAGPDCQTGATGR